MAVRVIGQPVSDFVRSVPWRAGMFLARSCVREITDDSIVFPRDLTYRRCLEIAESLSDGLEYGITVDFDPSFERFASESETFIEQRSRVGLAIKARDEAVEPEYRYFKDTVDSLMLRPLRDRQMRDAFFMASVRWAANFSVPGSGKTASVLGAFAFLRASGNAERVVVVCPKNAFASWRIEWEACFGGVLPLSCFCLSDPEVARLSREQRKRAVRFDSGRFNLMLFNYEALGSYVDELREIVSKDTILVFDEVHRVKAIDGRHAQWALDVAEPAQYVAALTGTPIPNTYQDIYNLLHLLYPADYDEFFGFAPGFLRSPAPAEIELINKSFKPFFCRTNKDELGVPRPNENVVIKVDATESESELLHILSAAYAGNRLSFIIRTLQLASDSTMLRDALDPEDFEYVLDQVGDDVRDIDFVDYSTEVPELIENCGISAKMRSCEELVANLVEQGKPVIVWCVFVRSIAHIVSDLNGMGIDARAVYGATAQEEREAILESFRAGAFEVLVTNPHTLAESVSLHQVCHDGVYFEYSYNLVHLLQSKDRIHRLGLPQGQYTQYYFFQTIFDVMGEDWSLDENIYLRLLEKEQTMSDAIDSGYLEGGYLDDEDIEVVLGDIYQRYE